MNKLSRYTQSILISFLLSCFLMAHTQIGPKVTHGAPQYGAGGIAARAVVS